VIDRPPAPAAELERTDDGLAVRSAGWFVLNLADALAETNEQSGTFLPLEGDEHRWPEVGVNVHVLLPGQQACRYHEESAQEDFLVLAGACVLVVEERELQLAQWDFFHCPGGTRHVFVGAGDGPCAILMIGARPEGNAILYPVSEAAARHGASVRSETRLPREAYADWPGPFAPTRSPFPFARA
jgi:uncharacterized cupin superfamily protein